MAGIKGRSGGRRKGAGRPKEEKIVSELVKNNYIEAAEKLARKHKMPVEEAILSLVYDDKVQDSVKVAAMKLYNEALLVKETRQNVDVNKSTGPVIGLPPLRPDPALEVVKGGRDKKK